MTLAPPPTKKQQAAEEDDEDSECSDVFSDDESEDSQAVSAEKKALDEIAAKGPEPELRTDEKPFCSVVAVLVTSNLFILGLDADFRCRTKHCEAGGDVIWDALAHLWTALFVLEICARIFEAGLRRYFRGERTKDKYKMAWTNCIDFTVVFLRVLDVWMLTPAGVKSGLRLISAFRIYQIGPFVRTMQLSKVFRELWLVISAFKETLKTLAWVAVLIFLVVYITAILFRIAVLGDDNSMYNYEATEWNFDDYWGSVLRSCFTLLQYATKDKWGDAIVWPLIQKHPTLSLVFFGFFVVAGLALMNSIVGVVVECTLASSKANAERETKQKQKLDQSVMDSLRQIFHDADTDGSGALDMEELKEVMKKRRVRDRLKMLGIPLKDLELLFTLLDVEQTNLINTDLFFRGCSKLRGIALASDLHQLSVDLNRHMNWCDENVEKCLEVNDMLGELLDNVDVADVEIVQGANDQKDPVLMARRMRQRVPKSEILRGQWSDGMPPIESEVSIWNDQARLERRHSKEQSKRASADASALRGAAKKKKKPEQDHGRFIAPAEKPAPPPLPIHIQRMKEQGQTQGRKRGRGASPDKKKNNFQFS
eukprot:TRINITY_DN8595_c0_g1_i1.p1 TRINITY_DN8595_c0_g1~~TRINITY_DN8595_c0_g1_i1.p1  ORF type:complete len:595 (-),score=104.05 TRINITY_DN8595_c0_g1_i1:362-2146(-)